MESFFSSIVKGVMNTASHTLLLLEALASRTHTSPSADRVGRLATPCRPTREKSQRSVAHGQDDSQWSRHDECLVASPMGIEFKDTLGRACSPSLNRRMRTRIYGGVGRARHSASLPDLAGYGCKIPRSRQIFRAKKSLISRCRGTALVCSLDGLMYSVCREPSRSNSHPRDSRNQTNQFASWG